MILQFILIVLILGAIPLLPLDGRRVGVMLTIQDTENSLYVRVDGMRWNEEFDDLLFEHIVQRSLWLSKLTFQLLVGFCRWSFWHEGLNA